MSTCKTYHTQGRNCVFPFIYKGKFYYECSNADSHRWSWCATVTRGTRVRAWHYCKQQGCGKRPQLSDNCPTFTSTPCVFPFQYRGVTYFQCTRVDSPNWSWCATGVRDPEGALVSSWAYCKVQDCKYIKYLHLGTFE